VPGGGSIALTLRAGQILEVTDPEGGQRCEARWAREAAVTSLFDEDHVAGFSTRLEISSDTSLVLEAPGAPLPVEGGIPPTDLAVRVTGAGESLPAPLAEPIHEIRVRAATAEAFVVRAGEYIQILDVAGRQCSDFLAFDAERLAAGVERGLDATATRTLMGASCPGPGLFATFFDQDFQPLVEVVQDTVGRHDTFSLACTAKYYEDQGYPGHSNCTDNFNAALAPHGIAPRAGWPAINFFFNTWIDAAGSLHMDEPWSRAGDYVLLRAKRDLLCATSSCADDIDPANGWEPTDIHVRLYAASENFPRASAFRMNGEKDARLTKETAFHPRTSALTRHFVEYRGYWLPASYTGHGAIAEYYACREKAALMDLSALRKWEVTGPDAENLLQLCLTRDVRRLAIGQIAYTAICFESGGMLDDGTVFRLGRENFRWIGGDEYAGEWLRKQAAAHNLRVFVKTSTDQLHNLALQGPLSREILADVLWAPPIQPRIEELARFRFTIGRFGGALGIPVIVSRTGYTGELGYEIWCHPKDAIAVWDATLAAGAPRGLLPLGLEALDMLRIEAGLIFAGHEFSSEVDPIEAGIGFAVDLKNKDEDFLGRAALERCKAGQQRALVGLEIEGNEPVAHGDGVFAGRAHVGVVTSAMRSPVLRKNLALARVFIDSRAPGTELEVGRLDGYQKRLPARVVPLPFYDPERRRVNA
jgi:aminomethyltransferase